MKILFSLFILCLAATTQAQSTENKAAADTSVAKARVLEASCGSCQFGLKMPGCFLAVRIDGKAYPVDGALSLDSYGDAHGNEGMCNAIRKAEVTGEVKNDRFVAKSFKLLPVEKKQ